MNNLNEYENILSKKRGWISKIPENKSCVFIFSGGLDSVSTIARLIIDFNMNIYPLFINRGQTNLNFEEKSVDYFNKFFLEKFSKNYNNVKKINSEVPVKSLKDDLQEYMKKNGYPLRDTFMEMLAVQYAISLQKNIKTVFSANVIDDPFPHCALQAMRSTSVNICENLEDWEWQITSPNIDKNISEIQYGKTEEIIFCNKHNIPIEKTISCYRPQLIDGNAHHCGDCLACKRRKQSFKNAAIEDKTLYIK